MHTSYLDWHWPMPPLLPAGSSRTKDAWVFAVWPVSHRFSLQVAEGKTDGPAAKGGITGEALGSLGAQIGEVAKSLRNP